MGRKHETEDLQKNNRRVLQEKKQKKKKRKQQPPNTCPELLETVEKLNNMEEEDMIKKSTGKRNEKDKNVDAGATLQISTAGKSKKCGKNKKKNHPLSKESGKVPESSGEALSDKVYHISSGDKDFTKGMKNWIMKYHQSIPGLKILQQRIDDFIVAHEEKLEQERDEKLARAVEGGWTVVVHHKGRKKTTDSETGITVGSVAQAAVEDKMAKKKSKEVGMDFYRFQRKEAQRNEIMMLQSKFEDDRKRIQQLRAARKFRPY